jgi:DNA invertase Pin-like site-specific DNA recombinase
MANYAYIRVSTNAQDLSNQKLSVLEYCLKEGINRPEMVEEKVTGTKSWQEREIGKILQQGQSGDVIVVAEVSRLARSTLGVLELLQIAAEKEISVHIAKSRLVMDGSMQATITATILGLAAQIEREFISVRTKEALNRRKAEGLPLGRPKGPAKTVKLDKHREEILTYLKKGVSKRSIARILECSPSTLYSWLHRNKVSL